jgi:hypothetical protein
LRNEFYRRESIILLWKKLALNKWRFIVIQCIFLLIISLFLIFNFLESRARGYLLHRMAPDGNEILINLNP